MLPAGKTRGNDLKMTAILEALIVSLQPANGSNLSEIPLIFTFYVLL